MGISSAWRRYQEAASYQLALTLPRDEMLHRMFAAGHAWGELAARKAGAGDSGLKAIDRLRDALVMILDSPSSTGLWNDVREDLKDLLPPT
jgi:hypothetical protein